MFSRTYFVIFLLILILFGYLFYLNPEELPFTLYQNYSLRISPALIAFGAFIIGAFFVFLVTLFVDSKRAFNLWRSSKRQKKEEGIRERYSLALEQTLKGNIGQAKEIFSKIVEKDPQHFASYLSLANLFCIEGKNAEAIEVLIRAKAIDPDNLELLFDLTKNYFSLKEYSLALETLNHILQRDPANREALRKKREIYIIEGNWNDAYQTQKSVVKYSREKEQAAVEKKILYGMEYKFGKDLAQKGNFKEAEKVFREIIREDREFIPAHVALGEVLQRQGSPDEAGNIWQKALESSWNPIFLERLESLYLSMAQPKKALNLYRNTLRQNPEDSIFRFFYGRLLIRLEMVDEAIEQLRDLDLSGISFPELYILMGQAFHRRGDSAQAIEAYEKALNTQKIPSPSYTCSLCGDAQAEWSGFCENCHSWGTYSIKLPEISKAIPTIPFYSYPVST